MVPRYSSVAVLLARPHTHTHTHRHKERGRGTYRGASKDPLARKEGWSPRTTREPFYPLFPCGFVIVWVCVTEMGGFPLDHPRKGNSKTQTHTHKHTPARALACPLALRRGAAMCSTLGDPEAKRPRLDAGSQKVASGNAVDVSILRAASIRYCTTS